MLMLSRIYDSLLSVLSSYNHKSLGRTNQLYIPLPSSYNVVLNEKCVIKSHTLDLQNCIRYHSPHVQFIPSYDTFPPIFHILFKSFKHRFSSNEDSERTNGEWKWRAWHIRETLTVLIRGITLKSKTRFKNEIASKLYLVCDTSL